MVNHYIQKKIILNFHHVCTLSNFVNTKKFQLILTVFRGAVTIIISNNNENVKI